VEAARASGAHPLRILLNTVLPNVAPPILVQFSLTVAGAILIESGLSFLGLGVVPPTPSWGLMIRGARATMEQNWLLLAWPSLALIITILAINRLCDALRDAFDPRLAGLARDAPAPRGPSAIPAARDATPAAAAMPAAAPSDGALLAVDTLRTYLTTPGGIVKAVDGVSLTIRRGETVALVGESGSGKSMTGLSILGLMPKPAGRIVDGSILLTGRDGSRRDLARLGEPELQAIRGNEIAMIFQEPMTSLNPVYRVGWQIEEAVLRHQGVTRAEARKLAVGMLDAVGIPDAARRARAFPHELSGGMRQRAMIAMALSSNPSLLIADEPTTALDVTIQAEILDLLRALQADEGRRLGLLFVTHNLGVVAEIADKVLVMYAGRIVEEADTRTLFRNPRHPYTIGLLASMPAAGSADVPSRERPPLEAIPGQVPSPLDMPSGCAFAPRCAFAEPACAAAMPELSPVAPGHSSRCRRWHEIGVGVKETA
jgi:peptide/nickel transport system permease protein